MSERRDEACAYSYRLAEQSFRTLCCRLESYFELQAEE